MTKVIELTKEIWKNQRKLAKIPKRTIGKGPSVGSAIDRMQLNRRAYMQAQNEHNTQSYISALNDLKRKMDSFMMQKGLGTGEFKMEIMMWKMEIDDIIERLEGQ